MKAVRRKPNNPNTWNRLSCFLVTEFSVNSNSNRRISKCAIQLQETNSSDSTEFSIASPWRCLALSSLDNIDKQDQMCRIAARKSVLLDPSSIKSWMTLISQELAKVLKTKTFDVLDKLLKTIKTLSIDKPNIDEINDEVQLLEAEINYLKFTLKQENNLNHFIAELDKLIVSTSFDRVKKNAYKIMGRMLFQLKIFEQALLSFKKSLEFGKPSFLEWQVYWID